ncbi:MAG TPA: Gldg family protein [Terriglobales bacterium]|nr:Gldg family protein [Terriglobales bacterium]
MARPAWQGLTLILQVVLGVVLFAMLVVFADRRNVRLDLTPTQAFTLSGEARSVVENLRQPVTIVGFYNSQQQGVYRQFEDLLQLFSEASPMVKYRLVDLDRSPREAARYNVGSYNSGVVEIGDKFRAVRSIDQESIIDAILRLTRTKARTLCFITSHGEKTPESADERQGYSMVAKALEKENFEVRTLGLVPPPQGEENCTVVILAGPKSELLPGEVENLMSRLAAGGATMVMVEPWAPPSMVRFLERAGVRLFDDLIIDDRNRFYGTDAFMPTVPVFDQQIFGDNLQNAAVFPVARTVHPGDTSELPSTTLLLALTSDESWARLGDTQLPEGDVQFRSEVDKRGPLPAAVIVRGKRDPDAPEDAPPVADIGPLMVFGDSDFAANNYLNLLGNRDLFMSSIAVLAEDRELVGMRRARNPEHYSPLYLTDEQTRRIFWVAVVIQPALFALLGIGISWRRRRKASA